ncbi:MAG: hypothetical protein JWQ87_2471 [Candidatus Sulfotelmatobacter sp.]|nr:hypothetical protein [Candidatus Sulfotelmatobacter sp.]
MTEELCTKSIGGVSIRCFSCSSAALKNSVLGLLLILVTSGFAVAADPKSNPSSCKLTELKVAGLDGNLSTDVHAGRTYTATVAHLLSTEKFEQLDCLADHARLSKERFAGGAWRLHTIYVSLDSPVQYPVAHATPAEWDVHLQHLQTWVTARPQSITARVALARAYLDYSYQARGEGTSDTVSQNGWKLYKERSAEAERILQEASRLSNKCPEWYTAMLMVAQNLGRSAAEARVLFDEAFKFEPDYFYNARLLANYLQPKWAGKAGETDRFMQEIADRIGGDQGDIFYFQVALTPGLICGCEDEPKLSMERIERGFSASEKQYGTSMFTLNKIAFVAANSKDSNSILADKALTRIGEQWDEETWQKKENFDSTKQWATKWAPRAALRLAQEQAAQANMRTAAGVHYKVVFEKTYRALLQQCVRTDGSTVQEWQGKFDALTGVGTNGKFEDGSISWMGPVVMCMYRQMLASKKDGSPMFPAPPQAPYWVKLDLDWTDFAPVAAK